MCFFSGDLAAAALDLLGQDQVEVQRVPIEEIQHRIDSNSNPFATIPEQVYLQLALGNTYKYVFNNLPRIKLVVDVSKIYKPNFFPAVPIPRMDPNMEKSFPHSKNFCLDS